MSIMVPARTSASKKRRHDASIEESSRKVRKLSQERNQTSSSETDESADEVPQAVRTAKHTKKERKQNRSTRIHSIRKLLARDSLPSTIRQEKERELSALLLEQEQGKAKKQSKKTLEKYHYVRFVERMKAEKKLKQLKKKQDEQSNDETLKEKIHEMEVNHSYAVYAPLSEKYVSIFASKQSADDGRIKQGSKPPMWYTIEKAMKDGEKALVALREGRFSRKPDPDQVAADDKYSKNTKKQDGVNIKNKLDKREKHVKQKSEALKSNVHQQEPDLNDEDLSDGGFFER